MVKIAFLVAGILATLILYVVGLSGVKFYGIVAKDDPSRNSSMNMLRLVMTTCVIVIISALVYIFP